MEEPGIAIANDILRNCVHCGFCTATCPTYVLTGNELDSPRGRIYLFRDMLGSDRPPSESTVRHTDRCLSCLSCMTTCPASVDYMHLVDEARNRIEKTYTRSFSDRLLRKYFEVTQIWDQAYSDKLTDFTTSRIRETLTYSHANPQGISWPLTISKH